VSPMALSFYDGCIRARNDKLKAILDVSLRYPTYRDGLRALHEAGDHLAITQPTEKTPNAAASTEQVSNDRRDFRSLAQT